jgi:predicted metal-dependent HD superfamily phosphohydrolase
MQLSQILQSVETHVTALFQQLPNEKLLYHNIRHTQDVVNNAATIAAHYQLPEEDNFAVLTAAWFHDVGYLFGPPAGHEATGAQKATAFLSKQELPAALVEKIAGCIMATCLPQSPHNLPGQIVCDADLYNFGMDDFRDKTKLLRRERELFTGKDITGSEWRTETLHFLAGHQYFTDYARAMQQKGKQENIDWMTKREEKQVAKRAKETEVAQAEAVIVTKKEKKKEKEKTGDKEPKSAEAKAQQPGRGIETMFRLTSANHLELSAMADSKANILVTVNSIIISVLISVLFRRLETSPHLLVPTMIFLSVCIGTIIFSVLATRPNVNSGMFSKSDITSRKTNLLFFGNFYRMKLDEYEWAMKEMINDREYLYGSLIKDIYFLGVVLGRKYRLLRIAYNLFMYGIVISVIAFAIAIFVFGKDAGQGSVIN